MTTTQTEYKPSAGECIRTQRYISSIAAAIRSVGRPGTDGKTEVEIIEVMSALGQITSHVVASSVGSLDEANTMIDIYCGVMKDVVAERFINPQSKPE